MIALNYWFGVPFTPWNIVEVVSWLMMILIGSILAAGRLWNRDVRADAGVVGVNTTMGDDDHEHLDIDDLDAR